MTDNIYDVIIVGSGPGGMTAALYASRANLSTLILERGVPGGEMMNTSEIENYPGYVSIQGPELSEKMYESAMHFGANYAYGNVDKVEIEGDIKVIYAGKKVYRAYALIIATGAHHKKLNVVGEDTYAGRGVSYCAVCDGAFFKDESLIVVGGGDSAVEEGAYLTQFAKDVTIVHRRNQLRAQPILQKRAFNNGKVDFLWDSEVVEILGDNNQVSGVRVQHVQTKEMSTLAVKGVFIYIGVLPNSQPFQTLGITDEEGWIITNDQMETTIPGVFAIGDVRQKTLRQVVTAVGDGGQAGQGVYQYVETLKEKQKELNQ